MHVGVVCSLSIVFLILFIISSWVFDHVDPRFIVNVVPPEGMDDILFRGRVEFKCPRVSYKFKYRLPRGEKLTRVEMRVEGRTLPIELCKTSYTALEDVPLCPSVECVGAMCYKGYLRAQNVHIDVCENIRDSHPQVRIFVHGLSGQIGIGSLVKHATE